MKRISVLVISHLYPNRSQPAKGIFVHRQVENLKAFSNAIDTIKVVSPTPWVPPGGKFISAKWHSYNRVPYSDLWENIEVFYPRSLIFPKYTLQAFSGLFIYWSIRSTVHYLMRLYNFDAIHAHVALPDGYAGMLLARDYNLPLIVSIHGGDIYSTIHRGRQSRHIVSRVVHSAQHIVVNSSGLMALLQDSLGPIASSDITIIPPAGLDMQSLCQKPPKHLSDRYHGHRVILSGGYLIKRKGHEYMLHALSHLVKEIPDLKYIIAGYGPEMPYLQELSAKLNLQSFIEFVGLVTPKEMFEYMSLCDIFALPSWDEAFGVVYIEAMAHRKPVIGCHGEGLEDFVTEGETGLFVKKRDTSSLETALRNLLTNKEFSNRLGRRGYEIVQNYFTKEKNTQNMLDIYKKVIEKYRISEHHQL